MTIIRRYFIALLQFDFKTVYLANKNLEQLWQTNNFYGIKVCLIFRATQIMPRISVIKTKDRQNV